MELRHLRYFLAVAEEGHITRAAERLGIQQPPLSQQIRALEDELEVQLFRRTPRGVELTEAGESCLADTRIILEQVARARARAERTARGEQGAIVVGFTSSAPFHPIVTGTIRAFRERYPMVSLALEERGTTALVEGVREERIDVAFIRSPVSEREGLAIHPLVEEPMFAALPSDHRLAPGAGEEEPSPLAIADLAEEPFILYRRRIGAGFYDAIIAACHDAGFTPTIAQEAPRILSTLNLVASGLGISFVPAALRQVRMAGVAYRAIEERARLNAPIDLACRRTGHSQAAAHFAEMARSRAGTEIRVSGYQ
jgi:DNA-binding transcriptional LysR family regulator